MKDVELRAFRKNPVKYLKMMPIRLVKNKVPMARIVPLKKQEEYIVTTSTGEEITWVSGMEK